MRTPFAHVRSQSPKYKSDMRATMMDAEHMERNQYQHIPHKDDIDQEANDSERVSLADPLFVEKLSARKTSKHSQLSRLIRSPVWLLGCIALAIVLVVQTLSVSANGHACICQGGANRKLASYEDGFGNDLENMKYAIDLVPKRFGGAIRSHGNGNVYFHWEQDGPRYTVSSGATWDEVDQSWGSLLAGRYANLLPSEISTLNHDPLSAPLQSIIGPDETPGIYAGPGMLHSLHCLDGLRKSLHMERYGAHMWMNQTERTMHDDHCIEQLRQGILCHGDMTPVTMRPIYDESGKEVWVYLGETEREHTCRDGLKLRDAWWERGQRTGTLHMHH